MMAVPSKIKFDRPAQYTYVSTIGEGACGETIRVRDEGIDCDLVIKKFRPFFKEKDDPTLFRDLLARFKDEARILFRINHRNIVRVFNFFDYSENDTSYIVMEFVDGVDVVDFLKVNPSCGNAVFEGVVDAFSHLHEKVILHRDIRPANILIDRDGVTKLIDFGFGKLPAKNISGSISKSVSLNWWCDRPPEFNDGVYDFQTEVYFVGKLFEAIIDQCSLEGFRYANIVSGMSEQDRSKRYKSFTILKNMIVENRFDEVDFTDEEISNYRTFTYEIFDVISSVGSDTKFERDENRIIEQLEDIYRRSMLESTLPSPKNLIRIFCKGNFTFRVKSKIHVSNLKNFIVDFRKMPNEKKLIIVENIIARFESVEKKDPAIYDEIPF